LHENQTVLHRLSHTSVSYNVVELQKAYRNSLHKRVSEYVNENETLTSIN